MSTEFKFRDVNADMSDIPSYASLDEAAILVAEANNAMFDALKREIGLQELGIFESTGNFVSYVIEEGEDKAEEKTEDSGEDSGEEAKEEPKEEKKGFLSKGKEVIKKIVELLKAAGAKVKGLFEAAMRKISEVTAKAAAAFGGKLDAGKLQESLEKTTIKFKSPSYNNLKTFIAMNNFGGKTVGEIPFNDVLRELKKNDKDVTVKNLTEHFEGSSEDHTLDAEGLKDIVEVINKFGKTNDNIKAMYKSCEVYFHDAIRKVESAEQVNQENLDNVKKSASYVPMVFGAALSSYYKLVRLDVGIALRLAAKGKFAKKKDEKAADQNAAPAEGEKPEQVNASAMVESLFNWSF